MSIKVGKFKVGQKVRVRDTGLEGTLVRIYLDGERNEWVYLVCSAKLIAPPLVDSKDLQEVLDYIKNFSENIETKLICTAFTLDSEDDFEILN